MTLGPARLPAAGGRPVSGAPRRVSRMFYGWWIIVAGAGIQMLANGLMGQAYGSYMVLLRNDYGWNKTTLSLGSSLREVVSGGIGPFHGALLDRLGARAVATIGLVLFGLGLMAFSQLRDLLTFYLAFAVISAGMALCGWTTITFAAVHWFERRRATAISLTSAGFAVGGILVPLTTLAMETLGWRETAFISGVVVLIVGLPLAQLIRPSPQAMGLGPDGDALTEPHHHRLKGERARTAAGDFTLREALHTASFWWVGFGHASALFIVSAINVHLVSHLHEDLGYSLGTAAWFVTVMTLFQLLGTLTGGYIGDHSNKRVLAVGCMGMHAGAILLLAHAANVEMVLAFAVVHGLAWGWRGPQMAAIRADYFGRSHFGKILGVSNLVIIIGTISGPLIAGYVYDQTGSYKTGFDILAGLSAAGSVFFILAKKPALPKRHALRAHGGG